MAAKIYEQADRTADEVTYCWLLTGVAKTTERDLPDGWRWIGKEAAK